MSYPTYEPDERPRKRARLKQLNKANKRLRRYYAELRRREIPKENVP